jgi:hypothetical protein
MSARFHRTRWPGRSERSLFAEVSGYTLASAKNTSCKDRDEAIEQCNWLQVGGNKREVMAAMPYLQ